MILRVGVSNFNFFPKIMKDEATGKWSGVYIDILEELAMKANFSYNFVINELNSSDDTGDMTYTYNLTRFLSDFFLVKSIAENRTDITVPGFVITEERHKIVDFTVPFFTQGLYIWIKKPEVLNIDRIGYQIHKFSIKALHSSWFTFLFPISFDVWLSLLVATAVVMMSMIILKVMNEGKRVSVSGSLMMILSSLLGQTLGETPR